MRLRHFVLLLVLLSSRDALARNFELRGKNELCGGIGFAGDFTDWTPGGFKWFNDYSRQLSKLTWLNFQFNVVLGGGRRYNCHYDPRLKDNVCDYRAHFGGYAVELAAGVKFKWRLRNVPLQFHAKVGGALDLLVFERPGDNISGVAMAVRGGFGVRYFFVPSFGLGAEIIPTFGPAFLSDGMGVEFYGAIDLNVGVEYRF